MTVPAQPFAFPPLMVHSFLQEWHELWGWPPGKRFESRYRRARRRHAHDEMLPRIFRVVIAVALFAIGVVVIFLPLPEIPFFMASGALLAAESLPLARLLDRTELQSRNGWERLKRWSGLPPLGIRLFTVGLALCALLLSGGFCYHAFAR